MKLWWISGALMILTPFLAADAPAQMWQRSEVPVAQQWRLADLYPSDRAWRQAKDELAGRLDEIQQYRGKLTDSAPGLLACLKLNSDISKTFGRLHSYAHMTSDQDTRDATYLATKQEVENDAAGAASNDNGGHESHDR